MLRFFSFPEAVVIPALCKDFLMEAFVMVPAAFLLAFCFADADLDAGLLVALRSESLLSRTFCREFI